MSFRIIIDESHEEFLFLANTEGLQLIFSKLDCVVLPYVIKPITYEKIRDDHVLILGAPQERFTDGEIEAILRFVNDGKILILISSNLGDSFYGTNLNFIARQFDFEFNEDQLEVRGDERVLSNVVGVNNFRTLRFSSNVRSILYSGCTIQLLDSSVKVIAESDATTIPAHAKIAVLSENERVFGIGGFNLFIDHGEYGLERENNLEFLYDVIAHLISKLKKPSDIEQKIEARVYNGGSKPVYFQDDDNESFMIQERRRKEINSNAAEIVNSLLEDQEMSNHGFGSEEAPEAFIDSRVSLFEIDMDKIFQEINQLPNKKAREKFREVCKPLFHNLEEIESEFDDFWLFLKRTLQLSKLESEKKINWGRELLDNKYQQIQEEISTASVKMNDIFNIFCENFPENVFDAKNLEEWYLAESELRQKIDMIRNNLLALLQ